MSPNTAPATQNCTPKCERNLPKTVEASFTVRGRFEHDLSMIFMIRAWSEHGLVISHPPVRRGYFFALWRRILYWKLQRFALRLSTQISPTTAPAPKSDTPRSPNTAPATQNCIPKSQRNFPKTVEVSFTVHGRFDHDPTMIRAWSEHRPSSRTRPFDEVTFSRFGDAFCIENYNIIALRLSTQISPNTAPATKSDTATSANTAPATKSDTATFLSCYCTELFPYWAVTLLNEYFSELLL